MSLGKEKIIETAAILFKEKGYAGTSVQDIADNLGVTKAALYYYFQSKEEILWEIIDRTMNTAEQRMQELMKQEMPLIERIKRIILNHIMSVLDDSPYMTVFFSERARLSPEKLKAINTRRRNYEECIANFIRQGIKENVINSVNVLPTVYGILGMCNWLYQWFNPQGPCKPEEIASIYSEIILDGLIKK